MTVVPLGPGASAELDVPGSGLPAAAGPVPSPAGTSFAEAAAQAFAGAGTSLERADAAERAFAGGTGTLQALVLERAQADVALSLVSAAASRSAQALTTILGMQV